MTGIARWKRARVGAMLGSPPYRATARAAVALARARGGAVAVWASRMPVGLEAAAAAAGVQVAWVEDGFIRSAGLGAALVPPASICVDFRAPYYDPCMATDLEVLLQTAVFDDALVARAARLIEAIVARGVTKYNLGGAVPDLPEDRRIVLVPGQVVDDRSVTLGGAGIASMEALLVRVRALEPDAHILFKPHPDVDAGLRAGAIPDALALAHADAVVRGVSLAGLLAQVDGVHTLTSLAGFEALLRGRAVTVHGQPFYAGWGLTRDLAPVARRTRRLGLDQLAAGTLIAYPRYCDPATGKPCTPEALIDALPAAPPGGAGRRVRALGGRIAARARG